MAQPPIKQTRPEARRVGSTLAPSPDMLDPKEVPYSKTPCAQKENDPTAGKEKPQRLPDRTILDIPDLYRNGTPEQDQGEEGEARHVHVGRSHQHTGHPAQTRCLNQGRAIPSAAAQR